MTIFNPIINSSTTNPASIQIPKEVELHIASFLPHQDKVTLSGVNRGAYQLLPNDPYFKDLYPIPKDPTDTNYPLKEKIHQLRSNHPTNFWKIACCFFQKGQINFKVSTLREVLAHEKEHCMAEKSKEEARLKEICGDYYEDPSSLIHQAWLVHQKLTPEEKKLVIELINIFHDLKESKNLDCFKMMCDLINSGSSTKEIMAVLKNVDERLIPIIASLESLSEKFLAADLPLLGKYDQLENERYRLQYLIMCSNDALAKIEANESHGPDTCLNRRKDRFLYMREEERFRSLLNEYFLYRLSMAAEHLNKDVYSLFKAVKNASFPSKDTLYAYQELSRAMYPEIAANLHAYCDHYLLMDDGAIDAFASQPLDSFSIQDCDSFLDKITSIVRISREEIETMLFKAIMEKNPDFYGESFFDDTIERIAEHCASRPSYLQDNFDKILNRLHQIFAKVPLETIQFILLDAVEKKYAMRLDQIGQG